MNIVRLHIALVVLFLFLVGPLSAHGEPYQSSNIPWSGYWWPTKNGGLATGIGYRGHPAPLEKYELLTIGRYPGSLTNWYKAEPEFYDPTAPSWYGMCLYWAWAACREQGDIVPSSEDNIIFRVGDKKGLLTLVHEDDLADMEYARPDNFHAWLLKYIQDRRLPFVADLDSTEEVWSHPIYWYDMQSTKIGNRESVVVTIKYANDLGISPDYRGTDSKEKTYTYDLFLDSAGAITGGEWTGWSITDHPDRMSFPLVTETTCPYIDIQEVQRIAQIRDDFLENGADPVDLAPGTYNLVLLDPDRYRISCLTGDTMSIGLEKLAGSLEQISAVLYDGSNAEVVRGNDTGALLINELITAVNPPYTLVIDQENYADPNLYTVTLEVDRTVNLTIPYVPNNTMWSGYSITNAGDAAVDHITLTTYTADGAPVQTLFGPVSLGPGEKKLFLFEKLPWRVHERPLSHQIALSADAPVTLLNLFGPASEVSVSCLVPKRETPTRFILPDTVASFSLDTVMFGGIENRSFDRADVSVRVYAPDGTFKKEVVRTIEPRARLSIDPNSSPFSPLPAGGWIEVVGNADGNICGYQHLSSSGKAESLFGLSSAYNRKIIPHVPPPGKWATKATIINPNDTTNDVILHLSAAGMDTSNDMILSLAAREKRTLDLQEGFGKNSGEPAYHSILEVNGQYPLAGYFTYRSGADEASLPLLDASNFGRKLLMPHYPPPAGKWWTGIGLCNPTGKVVTVWAMPYDKSGQPMEQSLGSFTIDPDRYEVFTVKTFFGAEAADAISFITFTVEEPAGMIGGFYLFGNEGNAMLAGGVM